MNPYQVLGIDRSASDEEIKKAYRNLSRKYHPDANINNPNHAEYEERFKQVQEAYNQIMDEKQNGGRTYTGQSYGYSNSNYQYQHQSKELQAAASYINAGQYAQALNVLHSIDDAHRSGQWYFYASIASKGVGNINNAREYIYRAIALEPSNIQYRQFYQSLNSGFEWYQTYSTSHGYTRPYTGVSKWCFNMLLLNMICNLCCCGGPRFF